MKKIIISAIIIIIIGAIGYTFRDRLPSVPFMATTEDLYAVHLTNGQVYFGGIDNIDDTTITMSDVYYLEVFKKSETVASSESFAVSQDTQDIYQLTKRGSTGTVLTDHTLNINRDVVLFWEKLAADSELVRLIGEAEKVQK